MAKAMGVSLSSVQRLYAANRLHQLSWQIPDE